MHFGIGQSPSDSIMRTRPDTPIHTLGQFRVASPPTSKFWGGEPRGNPLDTGKTCQIYADSKQKLPIKQQTLELWGGYAICCINTFYCTGPGNTEQLNKNNYAKTSWALLKLYTVSCFIVELHFFFFSAQGNILKFLFVVITQMLQMWRTNIRLKYTGVYL